DSLKSFPGGKIYFDTLATVLAYCNCQDTSLYKSCYSKIFSGQISLLDLMNNAYIKERYYEIVQQLYLQKRERFVALLSQTVSACAPCALARIPVLTPPPVFPPSAFTSSGALDIDGYFWSSMDTNFINLAQNIMNPDSLQAAQDSANAWFNANNHLLCSGQIDSIMSRLSDCSASAGVLNDIRSYLEDLCDNDQVQYGNYTPQ